MLKRTQIQIESEELHWLKQHALGRNVSMSQIIRECIAFYRTHIEKAKLLNSKKEKALTVVGSFSSKKGPER
ncbi:MAG: CopG family transcriptional regulator [Desulfobacteraceae bacterium]|nr:MAG: CopG family transcriptional regulator [Desulfobacteraceae bacterium]